MIKRNVKLTENGNICCFVFTYIDIKHSAVNGVGTAWNI